MRPYLTPMPVPRQHITADHLPDEIAVFPLSGVLLLPRGELPLNIFEPRYLAMVDDSFRTNRIIGMIQPREDASAGDSNKGNDAAAAPSLFTTGCAGRITAFQETGDGLYQITLTGLARFSVADELPPAGGGYRRVRPVWGEFVKDLAPDPVLSLDRARLKALLRNYFDMEGMECDWSAVDSVSDDSLMTCLSMVCPLTPCEKQALLEAGCCNARSDLFITLLEMATQDTSRARPDKTCRH